MVSADQPPNPAARTRPSEIVRLVSRLPRLAGAFDQFEAEWAEDPEAPGLYLYVDVIWEYLNPLLQSGREIDGAFFVWLEELATSSSQATRNFLTAGLLEVMGDNPEWLMR